MISYKYIDRIVAIIMTVAVIICFLGIIFSNWLISSYNGIEISMEYESKLFNTDETISIDILMDSSQWEDMLENAISEEYYQCDVVVNGETFYNVAIRPKGNTSLTSIYNDDTTQRYSFKLEFDQYVDGQTCFGLDKLILNNNYSDATNMKEAITYDMFKYLDTDASLYNYAEISVNGEYWGVYLALEGVEDSFILRNYGTQDGYLYKPETMDMGNMGDMGDMGNMGNMGDMGDMGNMGNMGDNYKNFEKSPMMGGNGANLNYSDDNLDSYSTIWDGSIKDTTNTDHQRVVNALKNINNGTDLEKYLDIDNILKYMAVHTFVVNLDSLSSNMAHNYYLYEYDGVLNILPWDYNLSLGGMSNFNNDSSDSASNMINFAIDTPFSGTDFFDAILENDEYLNIYHNYLTQLCNEYVNGGIFDETYNKIRNQIDNLVNTDPNAFYSYDEYTSGAEMLYNTIKLRAESVLGQVNGTIPSTDDEQNQNPNKLIDSSSIDISVMGTMSMGGGQERNFDISNQDGTTDTTTNSMNNEVQEETLQNPPSFNDENFKPNNFNAENFQGMNNNQSTTNIAYGLILYGISAIIMIIVILIAKFYKRKSIKK